VCRGLCPPTRCATLVHVQKSPLRLPCHSPLQAGALAYDEESNTAASASAAAASAALDCEFKPLRCAVVDEHGVIRLNHLIEPAIRPAGTSAPKLPGMLGCDRVATRRLRLPALQEQLRSWVGGGSILLGHTLSCDFRALEMDGELAYVDIPSLRSTQVPSLRARAGTRVQADAMSLKRMAAAYLGENIHGGGRKHCAVQDAEVAMRLHSLLTRAE